jgi:large subunit ribosomal protein L21
MYAIVEIAGQQLKVKKDQKVFVNRLAALEGETQEFTKVLLIDDDGAVKVGAPVVKGASVTAKVLTHARGEKVKIFKKKRRKGYQKETGHRQDLTQLQIEAINA